MKMSQPIWPGQPGPEQPQAYAAQYAEQAYAGQPNGQPYAGQPYAQPYAQYAQQPYAGQPYAQPAQPYAQVPAPKPNAVDLVLAVAGVVALIASFLPYYAATHGYITEKASAWHGFFGWFAALVMVFAGVVALLPRFRPAMRGSETTRMGVLGLGVVAVLCVILSMVIDPVGGGDTWTVVPAFGSYVALICALVILAGGFVLWRAARPVTATFGSQAFGNRGDCLVGPMVHPTQFGAPYDQWPTAPAQPDASTNSQAPTV